MLLGFFIILLGGFLFYFSSLHSLIVLLFVEILVLSSFVFLFSSGFSLLYCLIFILVSVCLGAYGVSLLVSTSRVKGGSYYLSL